MKFFKQLVFLSFALLSLLPANLSYAQSVTPSPSGPKITDKATNESLTEQINTLKDRIASRVAELNLVEKRGITGVVTDASDTQITIKDIAGKTRIIDVDEITKFSSLSKKANYGISDITQGLQISVLGIYNKETKRMLARFVDEISQPSYIIGSVKSVNDDDFSFVVVTEDNKSSTVDVENITKTSVYTKEDDVVKAGFSKILTGNRVSVVGYPDKKDKSRIIASRIIILPELLNNPKLSLPEVSPTSQPTPTTSGRRVTPAE